jgi:hypothetical protein
VCARARARACVGGGERERVQRENERDREKSEDLSTTAPERPEMHVMRSPSLSCMRRGAGGELWLARCGGPSKLVYLPPSLRSCSPVASHHSCHLLPSVCLSVCVTLDAPGATAAGVIAAS